MKPLGYGIPTMTRAVRHMPTNVPTRVARTSAPSPWCRR
jgi:hypothetical protein